MSISTTTSTVRTWADRLIDLSHSLHAEPEIAFREHRSAAKVGALLRDAGFVVHQGVGGLATALTATRGSGGPVIGICAEYDALPEIGHACGHNVNGAASVGAAIALGAVAEELDVTVKLIGTPAEEDFAGKALLLEAGVFDDVATAMMVHAAADDSVGASSYAAGAWDITYTGRSAHAATEPWDGINALDAVTVAQTAIGLVRQQLPPGTMVHGIVTEGGDATNMIPARASTRYEVRAPTVSDLRRVQERVRDCFAAGALAAGAAMDMRARGADYADIQQDHFMTSAYAQAAQRLGRTVIPRQGELLASTDMGNVSQRMPTIQPTIGYDTGGARHHTPEFARYGVTAGADRAVLDGATALAEVGVSLANNEIQRARLLNGRSN